MGRTFRFIRHYDGTQSELDVSLRCAHAADALLVAASLGGSVEVWDGERRLGIVGGEPAPPPPAPTPDRPVPEAVAPDLAPDMALDDRERPFNPFRPGAWRHLRGD